MRPQRKFLLQKLMIAKIRKIMIKLINMRVKHKKYI